MTRNAEAIADQADATELIRVRGLVQGVGFRPTVWHLARRRGLRGWVMNDGEGVQIRVCGPAHEIAGFVEDLAHGAPPLARIDAVERTLVASGGDDDVFRIIPSLASGAHTGVVPDAATCPECRAEVFDPFKRRYRYPFTNCTDCGPRLSIIEAIPYDRQNTTMRHFPLCPDCAGEYGAPDDRRFHAQPVACHACGPRAWLERSDGRALALDALTTLDAVDAAATLLMRGQIVAVKGLGGFQLACGAADAEAVARLRTRKRRPCKPLALMVRDLDVARASCVVTEADAAELLSPAAPIVIMRRRENTRSVAANVAPGIGSLGMMLPNTPLHHLMLRRMDRPVVLTSGNLSDEPQCIDNADARDRLGHIADYFLLHDRDIARRVDDSITRVVAGRPRTIRRARGHAPAPLTMPAGFRAAPAVLAMGGELKGAFCLLRDGQATLSHHMGDLENARTFDDYARSVDAYLAMFDHTPSIIAVDSHPDYISSKHGRDIAALQRADIAEVQHHHAHIAACMAENALPPDAAPVLGVALDGLGFGSDGTLWGGEFLLADYRDFERLATFKPVPMIGGALAIREPWRNTYAHLMAEMGWARFAMDYADIPLHAYLKAKPRAVLDGMIGRAVNTRLASSCGRLFDAVAAAVGICQSHAEYEGQPAAEFEAIVDEHTLAHEDERLAYPFAIPLLKGSRLPYVEPLPMWQALLGDLVEQTPAPVIAARFHKGLAIVITRMISQLAEQRPIETVALSGGVMQNRVLFEQLASRLPPLGLRVLTHAQVPANDGGLALGQATIAAARALTPH
jgi:hydrogenase maturation protein HypF